MPLNASGLGVYIVASLLGGLAFSIGCLCRKTRFFAPMGSVNGRLECNPGCVETSNDCAYTE